MRMLSGLISDFALAGLAIAGAALVSTHADAGTITVLNPSFEILAAGYPNYGPGSCAPGCTYSVGLGIPDWNASPTSSFYGQFQPGNPANTAYYNNPLPDGPTVAFISGGALYQTVVNSMVAGVTYTLGVDVGYRKDIADDGSVGLQIGTNLLSGSFVSISNGPQGTGSWVFDTVSLTATAADQGQMLSVVLDNTGGQGNFDNVSVSASPLPATWTMMIAGFVGLLGFVAFGGKKREVAATAAA
jgi:hypothetical protein